MVSVSVHGLYLGDWPHPTSEADRRIELASLLRADFETYREVRVEHHLGVGRVDLLAVPRAFDGVVLAFEVKGDRFDLERALKQSADYVGAIVLGGPHKDKRITACFLYPEMEFAEATRYRAGMFNLIAQWRVGRAFVDRYHELTLAIGYEVIWRSRRGWVTSKARGMLLGKRSMGGSRRIVPPVRAVNYVSNKLKEAVMTSRHEEQAERRRLAGSNTGTTYFQQSQTDLALEPGGRYSADVRVTGSQPLQQWPQMPAGNPWSGADAGVEPPFDVDIGYVEPVGTPTEVQQSLAAIAPSPPHPATGAASEAVVSSRPADATAPPPAPTDTGGGATFRLRRL
jgi:hypothetical protein